MLVKISSKFDFEHAEHAFNMVSVDPLFRFTDENGARIYETAIAALIEPERNTLYVDMRHVHSYSATLYGTIELQFYKYVNIM